MQSLTIKLSRVCTTVPFCHTQHSWISEHSPNTHSSPFFQTHDNMPDLDLPTGCRWHQTEKGEVFFINDLARTTSWTHPRVEQQLVQEKVVYGNCSLLNCSSLFWARLNLTFHSVQLPPLNSKRQTEPKHHVEHRPKATHSKQVSIDSGVGSQSGSCHLYRQRSTSNRVKHRSISDNALLSPQFSIHEKVSHLLPCGLTNIITNILVINSQITRFLLNHEFYDRS